MAASDTGSDSQPDPNRDLIDLSGGHYVVFTWHSSKLCDLKPLYSRREEACTGPSAGERRGPGHPSASPDLTQPPQTRTSLLLASRFLLVPGPHWGPDVLPRGLPTPSDIGACSLAIAVKYVR